MANGQDREQRFLLITTILVGILAWPTLQSILSEPSSRDPRQLSFSARGPASVADQAEESHTKSVTVDITCGDWPEALETKGTHLRLKSDKCAELNSTELSVVNKSNGFTASVFPTHNKEFTTDYIDLKEGENNIEISYKDELGTNKIQSLVVHRRAPASIKE